MPNSTGPAWSYSRRKATRSPRATEVSTCPRSSSGICRIQGVLGRKYSQNGSFRCEYRTPEATVQRAAVSKAGRQRADKMFAGFAKAETFCAGEPYGGIRTKKG